MGLGVDLANRSHPRTGKTNGDSRPAGDGLEWGAQFQNYHRVLNRAVWSSRKHLVTSFGLRWVSMMLLVPDPKPPRLRESEEQIAENMRRILGEG
jgi:hypothetical protein